MGTFFTVCSSENPEETGFKRIQMGGLLSALLGPSADKNKVGVLPQEMGPEADVAEEGSPLTPREIAYVHATWDLVKPDIRIHGVNFFIAFFEAHPDIQTRFKVFADKSIAELRESKRMVAHGTTVMSALDCYIANLDDVETVVEMLKTTGINHRSRGVLEEDFVLLIPVFMKFLKDSLGDGLNEQAEKAWAKLLHVVISVISVSYKPFA